MTGEIDAGSIDDALLYRAGDEACKCAGHATIDGKAQSFEERRRGCGRGRAATGRFGKRHGDDAQLIPARGLGGQAAPVHFDDIDAGTDTCCALAQEIGIGNNDTLICLPQGRQHNAQLGTDAGGFACSDDERLETVLDRHAVAGHRSDSRIDERLVPQATQP